MANTRWRKCWKWPRRTCSGPWDWTRAWPKRMARDGLIKLGSADYAGVIEATSHALEINPVYVDAMNWRNIALQAYGDWDAAMEQVRLVIEVDPLSIIGRLNYVSFLAKRPSRSTPRQWPAA